MSRSSANSRLPTATRPRPQSSSASNSETVSQCSNATLSDVIEYDGDTNDVAQYGGANDVIKYGGANADVQRSGVNDVIQYGGNNDVTMKEKCPRIDVMKCMTSLIVSMKLFGVYFETRPDVEHHTNAWGSQVSAIFF